MNKNIKLSVVVPTLDAAEELPDLLDRLQGQEDVDLEIIVIDSSSSDSTQDIATDFGVRLHVIERGSFDHGGTRTEAAKLASNDILVFMTQDALPVGEGALRALVAGFDLDPRIAAVYGRQLPKQDANSFAEHLRLFNYATTSYIRCYEDRQKFGFKTVFISNSFAAYRRESLEQIGYFENGLLFGEDTCAAAKLLLEGFCVAYTPEACVLHSHNYSLAEDFKRYFDIGVFHAVKKEIMATFGTPTGEGRRYVQSEIRFLLGRKEYLLIVESCVRNIAKFLAYNLGKRYTVIPNRISEKISMNRNWWANSLE